MANRAIAVVAAVAIVAILGLAPSSFVAAPRSANVQSDVATAGLVAAGAALPQAAGAFTFEGEEYFDIWFGV
eukprot:CAMPEP_0178401590 /NCGR_PEP_ID=MMETSP0689_2-20121128/16382_1 /TAXON_ID=160604 /ORGANISM="Amphidinium massartii, Strain CS-259" /LENGTH=71 /DNA_ID=CAMNT_0020022419 /DNA_START=63 /DNA_END=274 /DNA_ORIENTATION=-